MAPTEHPAWCVPAQCDADHELEGFGSHRSEPVTLDLGFQVMTDVSSVRVQLQRQSRPWSTRTVVTIEAGRGRVTLEVAAVRELHRSVGALLSSVGGE